MMSPRIFTALTVCLLTVSTLLISTDRAVAQEDDLLKHFPSSANALTLIDVEGLLATEMARQGSWADKSNIHYAQRPLDLPELALRVAIAAQLDSGDDLSRVWELAVMELLKPVPMKSIALREGGYVDELDGMPAVWTPSDTYFLALDSNYLGAMYPANRQFVSRWARRDHTKSLPKLNEYLMKNAARLQPGTQIVMVLDLEDVVRPHAIKETLSGLDTLADKQDDVPQLAKLMLGLKGLSLTVQVTDEAKGTIRVDFSEDVSRFGRLAQPIFLEALTAFGAMIPDLESWKVELLGETVVFSGPLSPSGLRKIGSILDPPSTKFSQLADAAPVESGTDPYIQASQQYYQSVHTLIGDLRESLNKTRDNHALWMERYGRKIDALPILNVDPDLLNWGASVAETFRSMSVTERSANVRSGTRKAYVNTGVTTTGYDGYGYGNSGWYTDATGSAKQKTQIDRSEKGAARIQRFGSWKEVEDSDAAIRIAMTQKYEVEF